MVLQILTLLGALGMFLFGMNMMSTGLQKAAGENLRAFLASMTSNPFKRIMTGLGVTAIIQSSSATTVMVVGFVSAGLLTLTQAVGVIMGANIGTTVTAWLISLLGFKMDISAISVPLMAVGFIFIASKKHKRKNIGEFIIGFALLFLGLSFMKDSVPDLQQTPEVLSFITRWTDFGFGSVLIFLVFGTLLTLVLQSSSATMALTLVMLSLGWIPFDMAAAMVLGENIGTTITANIAASVANVPAKRAAMAHTLFNVFGVVWALVFFQPFLTLIGKIISALGYPDPTLINYSTSDMQAPVNATAALYGVSMLHTLFNVINTCILVWFTPSIVKAVEWIVKPRADKEEEHFRLYYINSGPLATAELAVGMATDEIAHFAEITRKGFGYANDAIHAKNTNDFENYISKVNKYEEITDRIELEIANFLHSLPKENLRETTSEKMRGMYKIISELESIGDSCERIGRILSRRNEHGKTFDEPTLQRIDALASLVYKAYDVMIANLKTGFHNKISLDSAYDAEKAINNMRDMLREEEIKNREQDNAHYHTSVYYMDVVAELEKMGDYIINVNEALV